MTFSAPSHNASAPSGLQKEKAHVRESYMLQQGETDDVEVSPRSEEKRDAKPWAHTLAGG